MGRGKGKGPWSTDLRCTVCLSQPGRWCRDPLGRPRINAHKERIQAARVARKPEAGERMSDVENNRFLLAHATRHEWFDSGGLGHRIELDHRTGRWELWSTWEGSGKTYQKHHRGFDSPQQALEHLHG